MHAEFRDALYSPHSGTVVGSSQQPGNGHPQRNTSPIRRTPHRAHLNQKHNGPFVSRIRAPHLSACEPPNMVVCEPCAGALVCIRLHISRTKVSYVRALFTGPPYIMLSARERARYAHGGSGPLFPAQPALLDPRNRHALILRVPLVESIA